MKKAFDLLSGTGDGAFIVDSDQNIVFWSSSAVDILGYSPEEAVGEKCWRLLKGCTARGETICRARGKIITKVHKGEAVRHFDLLVQHRQGHRVLIGVNTLAVGADENGAEKQGLAHLFHLVDEEPSQPNLLRICMLGPMLVERPDRSIVDGPLWRRVKVRSLLAFLVLAQRKLVTREKIIDTLWPETEYEAALRNLNTTVYNLRRSLEPSLQKGCDSQYIIYQGGQYALTGESGYWLDVHAFDRRIRRARHEPDTNKSIWQYEDALALYRGDYMADLSCTYVYSLGVHHRLQDLYLSALEELGCLYEEQDRDDKAKDLFLRVLAVDPCRETACLKLMRLLLKCGDRAGAAAYCLQLKGALDRELNMTPSRETQLLCKIARCD